MNGKRQLVNVGGGRGWLPPEQSTDESGRVTRANLQHPLSVLDLTHDNLELCCSATTTDRPTTVSPVVHLISTPPCGSQLARQASHKGRAGRMLELRILRDDGCEAEVLGRGHGVQDGRSRLQLGRQPRSPFYRFERYVSNHSDARFSHGICPSCVHRHHPELEPHAGRG